MQHPLYQLAQQYVGHETVFFDLPAETMQLAAMYTGVGLDHLGGEQPVFLVHEADVAETTGALMGMMNDNWEAEHFVGALLTTRRFIFGNLDAVSLPLEGLAGAQVSGRLLKTLQVTGSNAMGQRVDKSEDLECKEQLAQFFGALCQYPPAQRGMYPQTTELAFPTEGDVTGAGHALSEVTARAQHEASRGLHVDGRTQVLLEVVQAASRAGMPPDQGADLVRRIMLFDRNQRWGRGQAAGSKTWLSPLSADDFEQLMHQEFRQCTRRFVDNTGCLQLEFRWDSRVANAAVSSAVGAASAAVFGVGWSSTPTTTQTTVRLSRLDPIVGFSVRACSGDRFTVMPRGDDLGFVQDIHHSIGWHEGRTLLLRAVFGWSTPLAQVQAAAGTELPGRLHQLLGRNPLALFFPPS